MSMLRPLLRSILRPLVLPGREGVGSPPEPTGLWILITGVWDNAGQWDDAATWNDGA